MRLSVEIHARGDWNWNVIVVHVFLLPLQNNDNMWQFNGTKSILAGIEIEILVHVHEYQYNDR